MPKRFGDERFKCLVACRLDLPNNNLDIVFAKTIQPQWLIREEKFTISPHLFVPVTDGPFADFE